MIAPEGTTVYLDDPASGAMSEAFTAGGVAAAVLTDASGNVLQRLSGGCPWANRRSDPGDAWGARRNPDGTVPVTPIVGLITRGFTGEEMMDDVGLINFNARLYDPQLGRFLSADPAIPNDWLDQLLDRYGYVGDNPLSLTDPTGLCFITATAACGRHCSTPPLRGHGKGVMPARCGWL